MKRMAAIYARKSVERVDSISIESQIEFCQFEARGHAYQIYSDNGYSGKNTDRPAFHQMMDDICQGKISTVIVYKLDRISRSILDFSEMMEIFQKYDVQFISATEKFDTSSPMGRAMLNICIVFAQLERETIQQRVTDAYDSRSKKGFYMGGRIPYGFERKDTAINGIHTSMYAPIPNEISDVKMMYEMYAHPHTTLGDVARTLQNIPKEGRREKIWNASRVSELLRNPIYCKADYSIYAFFKAHKCNLCNAPEEFNGINGLYLFRGIHPDSHKAADLAGHDVVIAPHEGVIDSKTWLACRKKLLNHHHAAYGKAQNSWLVGLVKCGKCGYAMSLKKSRRKDGTVGYFCCYLKTSSRMCDGASRTIRVNLLEKTIQQEIENKIASLSITAPSDDNPINKQIEHLQIEIDKLDSSIEPLVNQIPNATETVMQYINEKVSALDTQKCKLEKKLSELKESVQLSHESKLENCMQVWDALSFDDKVDVARILIEKILVYPDHTHIQWKI
ncbi:MAG: recombinase family protein [Ruminococcus sp.]